VAHRKVEWLLAAHARVTVVAPVLADELAELVARGAVQHVAQCFAPEQLRDAALAIAATDSGEVNAAVAEAARAARVPINVVDSPELSSFIFPAIIDRSPVIVAVGSGGRSPCWCGACVHRSRHCCRQSWELWRASWESAARP